MGIFSEDGYLIEWYNLKTDEDRFMRISAHMCTCEAPYTQTPSGWVDWLLNYIESNHPSILQDGGVKFIILKWTNKYKQYYMPDLPEFAVEYIFRLLEKEMKQDIRKCGKCGDHWGDFKSVEEIEDVLYEIYQRWKEKH